VEAVSGAVVARLWVAALGAVEKALSDAVSDAVVGRVVELLSGRVSGADVALKCGELHGERQDEE
jgi:hypothetical protein